MFFNFKVQEIKSDDVFITTEVRNGYLIVCCQRPGENKHRVLVVSAGGEAMLYENAPIIGNATITGMVSEVRDESKPKYK